MSQIALEKLTQTTLIPTFPEQILYALARHAPAHDLSLPLAYYHTITTPLTSPKSTEAVFAVFCQVGVSEAFHFARAQNFKAHKHLFEKLISFVLSQSHGTERAQQGIELVNQPFTAEEEAWFESHLTTGRARSLQGAADTMMIRRIATGKYVEAAADSKAPNGRKHDGVNWGTLKEGLKHGMGPRIVGTGANNTQR